MTQPTDPVSPATETPAPADLPAEVRAYLETELADVRAQIDQLKQAEEGLRMQFVQQLGQVRGMRAAEEMREAALCGKLGLPLPRPIRPLVRFQEGHPDGEID